MLKRCLSTAAALCLAGTILLSGRSRVMEITPDFGGEVPEGEILTTMEVTVGEDSQATTARPAAPKEEEKDGSIIITIYQTGEVIIVNSLN